MRKYLAPLLQEFAIRRLSSASDQVFSCHTQIDGRAMDRGIVRLGKAVTLYGADVSVDSIRPFKFSPLDLTDGA